VTRIGLSITMQVAFRDSTQEFSNVFFYDGLLGRPSVAQADALIDEQVTRMKPLFGSLVTFVRGRLWEQTGDKATTEMISQKVLSGTGSAASSSGADRERAYLFRLRAGVDSRGNPVYLRKWLHAQADIGGVSTSGGIQQNTTGFTTGQRSTLAALMNPFGSIGSGTTLGTICAKGGRQPTAGAQWEAHKYLEHRQLGDQWRAN
jgi:hypothetical protein